MLKFIFFLNMHFSCHKYFCAMDGRHFYFVILENVFAEINSPLEIFIYLQFKMWNKFLKESGYSVDCEEE